MKEPRTEESGLKLAHELRIDLPADILDHHDAADREIRGSRTVEKRVGAKS